MTELDDIDDATLRDLVRLVDGTLPADRRTEVEERVSREPALQAIVEQQLRGRALGQGVDEQAPSRVHATIAARARRGAPRPNLALVIGAGAAVAAVLVAMLVVLVAPNTQDVTVEAVAEVALRAPEDAVSIDENEPVALEGQFDGLRFPNWESEFPFAAAGRRDDTVEGRTVRTTYYDDPSGERRLAYSIVSGGALDPPQGDARAQVTNDVEMTVFEGPLGPAVTWERDGHTCVLSGIDDVGTLTAMASWKGGGALAF